ncbi:MAG: nitrate- and nitrite sensing domain-containing protein [Gemmatimonadota bacterium]
MDRRTFAPAAPPNGVPGEDAAAASAPGPRGRPAPRAQAGLFRGLKDWRVRSRLLLLITIPTLAALVLGGASMFTSVRNALAYQRVQQRATLASAVIQLAQRLEDERDQTVYFISLPAGRATTMHQGPQTAGLKTSAAQQLQVVVNQQKATDQAAQQVRADLAQVIPNYTAVTQQAAADVQAELNSLPALRHAATGTQIPPIVVVAKYATVINDLLALEAETAQGTGDATLSQTVRVLGLVSLMKEQASEQRAILTGALIRGVMLNNELQALNNAEGLQSSDLQSFMLAATPAQRQLWDSSVSKSFTYLASAEENQAIFLSQNGGNAARPLAHDPTTADDWYGAMTNELNYQMGGVERSLAASVVSRTSVLRNQAVATTIGVGAAVVVFLALALLFTALVARSMVRPLRRLRAGALEVAGVRLPETVRRMSESDGESASSEVEPIDVDSRDEIGEVARAFDAVHREAIRLASNEAALRGNVNAMFVNLSRRSQSLVERQIRLIDDLEQGEQDAERLSNMFQLDHLATRMRRNSENLLVLAGHEVSRRWTQAVALVDVLRAAVSEIEQYERVSLNVQPGIQVRGQAVNDVVHLVAELAENATSFSAADTPVNVSGHLLTSGGVLLDITDQGVGMGSEEMAHANWRLDNPPVVDVAVSRRMGLFVVARLAARHGIRVRLRPASMGGLTALVWLPDEVVSHDATTSPGLRRFEVPSAAAAAPAGGGTAGQGWDGGPPSEGRVAAERAVNAALAPRFTPLRADGTDTASFPATPPKENGTTSPATGSPGSAGQLPTRVPGSSASVPPQAQPPAVTGPLPVYGAPVSPPDVDSGPRTGVGRAGGYGNGSYGDDGGQVVVPPAGTAGEENRLPIFESVESDWFRRGRKATDRPAAAAAAAAEPIGATAPAAAAPASAWTSPADVGWQAAEAAAAPAAGGTTKAGLPKRVPRANLVPGTVSGDAPAAPPPVRSAAITRERFASLQRGVREARAAARDGESTVGEEDSGN